MIFARTIMIIWIGHRPSTRLFRKILSHLVKKQICPMPTFRMISVIAESPIAKKSIVTAIAGVKLVEANAIVLIARIAQVIRICKRTQIQDQRRKTNLRSDLFIFFSFKLMKWR